MRKSVRFCWVHVSWILMAWCIRYLHLMSCIILGFFPSYYKIIIINILSAMQDHRNLWQVPFPRWVVLCKKGLLRRLLLCIRFLWRVVINCRNDDLMMMTTTNSSTKPMVKTKESRSMTMKIEFFLSSCCSSILQKWFHVLLMLTERKLYVIIIEIFGWSLWDT